MPESSKQSRQLPGNACDECRRRKLRCDRKRPRCGSCANNPNIACNITEERVPRGPKKGSISAIRNRIARAPYHKTVKHLITHKTDYPATYSHYDPNTTQSPDYYATTTFPADNYSYSSVNVPYDTNLETADVGWGHTTYGSGNTYYYTSQPPPWQENASRDRAGFFDWHLKFNMHRDNTTAARSSEIQVKICNAHYNYNDHYSYNAHYNYSDHYSYNAHYNYSDHYSYNNHNSYYVLTVFAQHT
ncbi:hypothetical protein V8F20_012548 [Naviculisporaceae sp. PSN 640]